MLSLIHNKVTDAQNEALIREPSEEEITAVVKNFPKEKSPGLDGVTAEVLQNCWDWMKIDCCTMVRAFWSDGLLTSKSSVIHMLKNWRPLTMLTITHKIAAKLLTNRLKMVVPKLVYSQQTGFIAGRSILDNVLVFKVGQEYANTSQKPTVFLKLTLPKPMTGLTILSYGTLCCT